MRIGVVIGRPGGYGDTLSQLVAEYEQARAAGVSSVWMTQHLGFDALTLISSWGVEGDVEVGSAGTITWMTGAATIESYVSPTIRAAAEAAGRPDPRVVVCLPVCVTGNPASARERLGAVIGGYRGIPSYEAMLEREGVADAVDVPIIGSADEACAALTGLPSRAAADVVAIPAGDPGEVGATWARI